MARPAGPQRTTPLSDGLIPQRLDLRHGIWTCPGCGAQLGSGDLHGGDEGANLEHARDCAEVSRMARNWNWPPAGEADS